MDDLINSYMIILIISMEYSLEKYHENYKYLFIVRIEFFLWMICSIYLLYVNFKFSYSILLYVIILNLLIHKSLCNHLDFINNKKNNWFSIIRDITYAYYYYQQELDKLLIIKLKKYKLWKENKQFFN